MTDFHAQIANWRRHLHERPELGFEEIETSNFIAARLEEFGIPCVRGIGGTGVVGIIEGRPGRRSLGLRADMDALPIEEQTGKPYASRIAGRMHACGHDGHIAALLGAAQKLGEERDFTGNVFLIFQPAEETGGGAKVMIEDGLFERFPAQEIYGLHNWPGLEKNRFAIRPGAVMAASDAFDVTIGGSGCHAAMPHQGRDPVLAASALVCSLQQVVSRTTAPWDAAVLSVTRMAAGSAYNVTPEVAQISGTLRSLSKAGQRSLRNGLRRVSRGIAAAHGVSAKLEIRTGYPVTVNSVPESRYACGAAEAVSRRPVFSDLPPSMATEDFAYMLEAKPGCYCWLGAGVEAAPLHSDLYDFDDELLPVAVDFWLELVRRRLGGS